MLDAGHGPFHICYCFKLYGRHLVLEGSSIQDTSVQLKAITNVKGSMSSIKHEILSDCSRICQDYCFKLYGRHLVLEGSSIQDNGNNIE
jgi:hypothetical protein